MRMPMWLGVGVGLLSLTFWGEPAQAWTGTVSWPTFYRAGPGRNFTVIDELDRGETLEVLSCSRGWCRVESGDTVGYTEQEWIVRAGTLAAKPATAGPDGCVPSRVTGSGYKGGLEYRFCTAGAQAAAPSGEVAPGSVGPGAN